MHYIEDSAARSAAEVRKSENLLPYVRDDSKLKEFEEIYREQMFPDIPSYDVACVQPTGFTEWGYSEGFHCFRAYTQSVEINARLMIEATKFANSDNSDYCESIVNSLTDKWELDSEYVNARGRYVFFPPGNNLGWIVNTDNVLKAFEEEPEWMLKPHPMTSADDVRAAKNAFGITRIYDPKLSGIELMLQADKIGYTSTSEIGILAMMHGKSTVDFTKYEFEGWGSYHSVYLAVRDSFFIPKIILNRIINCPWSGIVPFSLTADQAATRFKQFKEKTLGLRDKYRPVTRPLPPPPLTRQPNSGDRQ